MMESRPATELATLLFEQRVHSNHDMDEDDFGEIQVKRNDSRGCEMFFEAEAGMWEHMKLGWSQKKSQI